MNIISNTTGAKIFLNRHAVKEPGFFVEVDPSTQNPSEAAELLRFRCAFLKVPLGKSPPVQHAWAKQGEGQVYVWLKTIQGGLGLMKVPATERWWANEFVQALNGPPETYH
jgi:hypothetical protein